MALVAIVAGGDPATALRLGASMTLLQFAIGAVNDVVDAPLDAAHPAKPIPAGLVPPLLARVVAMAAALGGLALALPSGPWTVLLAALGLGIGLAYDLRVRGTRWSWVPFAVGLPLLPVYGWLGATGGLPVLFLALVPIAVLEGAALAVANAVVDLERDAAAGTGSVALHLGARRSSLAVLALQAAVATLAMLTAAVVGAPGGWLAATALAALVPIGGAALGARAAVRPDPAARELAWEAQAVGAGLVAVAWLAAMSAAGGFGTP